MHFEEFNRKLSESAEESRLLAEREAHLIKQFKSNSLPKPNILWHLKDSEIDLSLQSTRLNKKLVSQPFTVIPKISIEKLLDLMDEADTEHYRKRYLYDNYHSTNSSITSVLECWYNNQKLIPPTIVVYDNQYIQELCPSASPTTELRPADGKHRLKVAYYFGETEMPILVLKRQKKLIKSMLGIK